VNVRLIIADERAVREALHAALPDADLILFEGTVDDALRRLISVRVDTVIVDDAPGLGHQAVSRVLQAAPTTPVVVLSGRGDSESLAAWTLAGARACVVKPFSCEALNEALHTVAGARPGNGTAATDASCGAAIPAAGPIEAPTSASISQHQMALRWVGRTSSHIEDPRRLSQSLVDAATDIFDAVRSAVLLHTNGSVHVVASHGLQPSVTDSLRLDFASGLMRWFEENVCLFDRLANPDPAAAKELRLLGGRLAVPLMCGGRVCGALVVGEKASGLEYTFEERGLLAVIGRCASTALEKAQAYRDTSAQQTRLDTVLANITAGVVTVLPNRTVAMMNQPAERILNLRAVDVLGLSVQKLGSGFADVVLRTLADGKARLRREVRDPVGRGVLGLSVTPMGADGVVAVFSRLPEETVSRDDVAYSPFWEYLSERLAQEIKNPMVAIKAYAQLLPRKYDSEDFRESFSQVVQEEIGRINAVVETLFAFSSQPELTLQRADVNETVRSVLRSFEDELAERRIELQTDLGADAHEADLDPVRFYQAVDKVVRNSVEAMPNGGRLHVSTKREDDKCQVVIADTGSGIDPENAPLVFLPFFSTKERGMGLGLTTAKRILQQHDGDVELVEGHEGGAAFTVALPAPEEDDEDDSGH